MIETKLENRLRVSVDGDAVPYVVVPTARLDEIRTLLDSHQVRYWVDAVAISVGGKPEVVYVNLNRSSDPALVQQLLDGAA